jgi:Kinesin motor domain
VLLTLLLTNVQESLGGNAKTMLICNISPAVAFAEETQITLEFARGAKELKNRVRTAGCLPIGISQLHLVGSRDRPATCTLNTQAVSVCFSAVSHGWLSHNDAAMSTHHLTHALLLRAAQALRNLTLEGDPEVLRREVARLTAELAALRGGRKAAALELMSNELAAANEAGPRMLTHGLCCTHEPLPMRDRLAADFESEAE